MPDPTDEAERDLIKAALDAFVTQAVAVEREHQWQPIETAPKDGTFLLVALQSGMVLILQWCQDGYWRHNVESAARFHPKYWMQLPNPPDAIRAQPTEGEKP